MTEKQKQLVVDNHNLIYSFLHKHGFDEEEFYDLAAIGLCKAAKSYKDDIFVLDILREEMKKRR